MYNLELTADEMDTITFVGGRYCWSESLRRLCHEGLNELPEHIACELVTKLYKFRESII